MLLLNNRAILKSTILFAVFSLTGCAGMNSKFDCNVKSGGTCRPIHSINKMADEGAFTGGGFNYQSQTPEGAQSRRTGYPLPGFAGQPIRYGEAVQRIWIAPYEDISGNYHEPSYIYTVVKKGHWIGDPVIELKGDD